MDACEYGPGFTMGSSGAPTIGQDAPDGVIRVNSPADLPEAARKHIATWGGLDPGPVTVDPAGCLQPTDVIDSGCPAMLTLTTEWTGGLADDGQRAAAHFDHVRDVIRYDFTPTLGDRDAWRASATFARGRGFCQQKAVLLVALARAAGIPAGLVFQHIVDWKLRDTRFEAVLPGGVILFHGLCALWLDGAWRTLDPSLDSELCARRRYRIVEFCPSTGLSQAGGAALLPANDLDGHRHFDILGQSGPFADMPLAISDMLIKLDATWSEMRHLAARTGATM